jgi:hypothetical protein
VVVVLLKELEGEEEGDGDEAVLLKELEEEDVWVKLVPLYYLIRIYNWWSKK